MPNYKNRGMFLETIINQTIVHYDKNNAAIFHKNPLQIKFSEIKKEKTSLKLTTAWIKQKSTVDYYGVYQGKFIAFEVKSTNNDKFYLKNIKNHQANYLEKIIFHQALGFYLIGFDHVHQYFIIEVKIIKNWPKKSLSLEDAKNSGYKLVLKFPGILDFIPVVNLLIKKCR